MMRPRQGTKEHGSGLDSEHASQFFCNLRQARITFKSDAVNERCPSFFSEASGFALQKI